jgi:hypothetical protein
VLINFLSNEEKNEIASISTKFYKSHMSWKSWFLGAMDYWVMHY